MGLQVNGVKYETEKHYGKLVIVLLPSGKESESQMRIAQENAKKMPNVRSVKVRNG